MNTKKKIAVLISGGGTNLQALLDAWKAGALPLAEITCVVSNRKKAYGLERARQAGVEALYLPTTRFADREEYHLALRDLFMGASDRSGGTGRLSGGAGQALDRRL